MVFQTEKGTWSEILEDDKQRMDAMRAAAVERLVQRFGDEPDSGTDSLDGATTFVLRREMALWKVNASLSGWRDCPPPPCSFTACDLHTVARYSNVSEHDFPVPVPPEREVFFAVRGIAHPMLCQLTLAMLRVSVKRIETTYLLDGRHHATIHTVCKASSVEESFKEYVCEWLRLFESGRGLSLPFQSAYNEYHASHLQRLFLRALLCYSATNSKKKITSSSFDVAIAGSFAINVLEAKDIDIFVTRKYMVRRIVILYQQIVLSNLGLVQEGPSVFHLIDKDDGPLDALSFSGTGKDAVDSDISPRVTILDVLAIWESQLVGYMSETSMKVDGVCANILSSSKSHLPEHLDASCYNVLRSVLLRARSCKGNPCSRVLLPINITLVRPLAMRENLTFPELIVRGFDLNHCRAYLTVSDDLRYDQHMSPSTSSDVAHRTLRLGPTSFRGHNPRAAVSTQLRRIHKYALRGYSW